VVVALFKLVDIRPNTSSWNHDDGFVFYHPAQRAGIEVIVMLMTDENERPRKLLEYACPMLYLNRLTVA